MQSPPALQTPRHRTVAGLGLATIVSYGGWYYSFGVLVQPISDDTGWTLAQLGAAFAAGQLLSGMGAAFGGRLLDRHGGRRTFAAGGVVGAALLGVAAVAQTAWVFGLAFALAAAVIGSTGFYHVTMASARRLRPDRPARAIGPLTIYGALASPIFLPLTAVLLGALGWRPTLGVLAMTSGVGLVVAALLAPDGRALPDSAGGFRLPLRTAIAEAWALPTTRRLVVLFVGYGFGSGMILAYQVPIMAHAGLPLATAAGVAGGRGFMQLAGRIGLDPLVSRFGARRPLALAATLAAGSCGLLVFGGTLAVAVAFAVVAGVSMGAQSPLSGIHSADVLPEANLGALMGAVQALGGAAAAAGPLVGGLAFTASGSHVPAVVLAAVGFLIAAIAMAAAPSPRSVRRATI